MSRLRWVYLLSRDHHNRLVCQVWQTRLLKFSTFQDPQVKRLLRLMNTRLRESANEEDLALLPFLIQMESSTGGEAVLDGTGAVPLVRRIVETKRAYLHDGDGKRLHWSKPVEVIPQWRELSKESWMARLHPCKDAADWQMLRGVPPLAVNRERNLIGPVKHDWPDPLLDDFLALSTLSGSAVAKNCVRLQNRFSGHQVPVPDGIASVEPATPSVTPVLRIMRVESLPRTARFIGLNTALCARLSFQYGSRRVPWNDRAPKVAFVEEGKSVVVDRDVQREADGIQQLRTLGLHPRMDDNHRQLDLFDFHAADFFLKGADGKRRWEHVLRDDLPRLRAAGWTIEETSDIRIVPDDAEIWYDQIEQRGRDWYAYEAGIAFEGVKIPVVPLLQLWLSSRPDLQAGELASALENETFAVRIDDDGQAVLVPGDRIGRVIRALLDRLLLREPISGKLRVSAWRVAELAEEGVPAALAQASVEAIRRFVRAVRCQGETHPVAPLPSFGTRLRPYQKLGLGWLRFLAENGLSGILADDMGLGKTVQVIALLHHCRAEGRLGPVLIVCPASVLRQWQSEFQRFAGDFSVNVHYGINRVVERDALCSADVVITTYGILRQDLEMLESVVWDWAILDEAHVIKNPLSRTSRAATHLTARCRLCLTGTPVENRLSDLWSLFRFVMPGLLGDLAGFHKEFAAAAHDAKSATDQPVQRLLRNLLRQRIAPFLLRRRKEDVLKDLPPKVEIDRLIPITERQAEIYEAYRLRLHRELTETMETRGLGQAQLPILEGLLRLRQICCDPRLTGDGGAFETSDSAKLRALISLVEESVSEGRAVLVFSQFVKMLRLIEEEIRSRKWQYEMLTGETRDRAEVIERFQKGLADVFLISLKAGGLGLNLTRAETVIHYDPWWNPAAESQATDRAHRIGQRNPVTVYRLISEKTIEERILALHASKRELAESLVSVSEQSDRLRIDAEVLEQLIGKGLS